MTHYHYFTILYKFKIMSNYSRSRDYCTSGRHVVSMCVNVIKVSVYLHNWSHVISYVNKALATPELSEDSKAKNNEVLVVMTR